MLSKALKSVLQIEPCKNTYYTLWNVREGAPKHQLFYKKMAIEERRPDSCRYLPFLLWIQLSTCFWLGRIYTILRSQILLLLEISVSSEWKFTDIGIQASSETLQFINQISWNEIRKFCWDNHCSVETCQNNTVPISCSDLRKIFNVSWEVLLVVKLISDYSQLGW